jgi:hypothetical protein
MSSITTSFLGCIAIWARRKRVNSIYSSIGRKWHPVGLFSAIVVSPTVQHRSYDARAADLPFSEWPTVFPNAATTTALIDRVVHHAEIIAIEGESYRRRVADARRKSSPSPSA